MNVNTRQTAILGGFLIGLGAVWALNLWWLLFPAACIAAGVGGYLQRRAMGRNNEAFQALLWGSGLGIFLLAGFIWPGILFLAGASILLRGREAQVEAVAQHALARMRVRRPTNRPAESVPVETVISITQPSMGDTTRLHE